MNGSNYGGKVGNNTANVKNFNVGNQIPLWKTMTYNNENILTPTKKNQSVYIQGNLYVDGTIINPSDVYLKDNIEDLSTNITEKIMNLRPTQFKLKTDPIKKIHYGFIAQEFEEQFPELVVSKVDKNVANLKGINYLEIVPLLVHQIQRMQKEIDDLKQQINNK
jgi:filamentous hemagglutinin family protein